MAILNLLGRLGSSFLLYRIRDQRRSLTYGTVGEPRSGLPGYEDLPSGFNDRANVHNAADSKPLAPWTSVFFVCYFFFGDFCYLKRNILFFLKGALIVRFLLYYLVNQIDVVNLLMGYVFSYYYLQFIYNHVFFAFCLLVTTDVYFVKCALVSSKWYMVFILSSQKMSEVFC